MILRGLAFGHQHADAMDLIGTALRLLDQHPEPSRKWKETLDDAERMLRGESRLRLVLTGRFSSGKSSLITALTGHRLEAAPGPTTREAVEIPWKGVVLVDTPGVNSDRDEVDHDRIAKEVTASADLVLFVMTNELFNDRLHRYFHYLASSEGLGLASKMVIIVNKMDRERNSDEAIVTEVAEAIYPYTDVPIHLCSVKRYLELDKLPADFQDEYLRKSRMQELQEALDDFIRARGAVARLTTPLQLLEQVVSEAGKGLVEDEVSARQAEFLRRQARILEKGRQQIEAIARRYQAEIMASTLRVADETAALMADHTDPDYLEAIVADKMAAAVTPSVEKILGDAATEINELVMGIQGELEELGASPLGRAIQADFTAQGGSSQAKCAPRRAFVFPDQVLKEVKPLIQQDLKAFLDKAAADAKGLRDIVYEIGKKLGKKWRPHEAARMGKRLAKMAEKAGRAIPFVVLAIDLFMNYREEKKADEQMKQVARARVALHQAFREQGRHECEAFRKGVVELRREAFDQPLALIEGQVSALQAAASSRRDIAQQLTELGRRSRDLRMRITGA